MKYVESHHCDKCVEKVLIDLEIRCKARKSKKAKRWILGKSLIDLEIKYKVRKFKKTKVKFLAKEKNSSRSGDRI